MKGGIEPFTGWISVTCCCKLIVGSKVQYGNIIPELLHVWKEEITWQRPTINWDTVAVIHTITKKIGWCPIMYWATDRDIERSERAYNSALEILLRPSKHIAYLIVDDFIAPNVEKP